MKNKKKKIIFVACDTSNLNKIKKIINQTKTNKINIIPKFGLQFFYSKQGRKFLEKININFWLDLKINDIPQTALSAIDSLKDLKKCKYITVHASGGFEMLKASVDYIPEAEYKGKKVQLNKPKRGGSKKFYVYVKNPKTGNIKKVSFGDTGLAVKFKKPGARASFAARHKCAQKKDKTKAGYWSCNIGRYWKSLGGSKNFSGYW